MVDRQPIAGYDAKARAGLSCVTSVLKFGLHLSVALPVTILCSSPGWAQDGTIGTTPTEDEEERGVGGLEEIVVTARQRSENMQETPLSIAAVSGDLLARVGADSLIDLDGKVPSLQFGNTSVRLQTYTGIRGVGDYSRNPGYDNRAGIYLDGIVMGRSAATDYPIFDVERIEVLRGPQGTLFGKDALTGVINITSIKPKFEDEMKGRIAVGSRSLISGFGVVNAPLSDSVAIRLSISGKGQRGYYRNEFDKTWLGGGTVFAGRGQLRWLPGSATTVDLSFDAVRDDANTLLGGTPLTGPGVAFSDGNRTVSFNKSPKRTRKIFGVGMNVEHRLGEYALTSITAYRESTNTLTGNDFDLSPLEQGSNVFLDKAHAFSQELRLASPGDNPFNYVVGAFYYDQVASSFWKSTLGPDFPLPLLITDDSRVPTRIAALFGHATWKPFDLLTLDAGLRYNHTRKSVRFDQFVDPNGRLGFITVAGFRDSLTEDSIDPMASITLNPLDDVHVYATYSTGKRPGGWNADIVKTPNIRFADESGKNYEAGLKTELFDRHLRLNVAAYVMKFRDFQVTQLLRENNVTAPQLTNAGRVTSKGVELDFDAALFDNFDLSGGVGYNKAIYDSFKNGGGVGVDFDGNRLIEAPRWTVAVTGNYEVPISQDWDASLSLTYTYKSATFADPSNAPRFRQDAYNLFNGQIAFGRDNDAFRVALFGRNLTNTKYREAAFASALNYTYVTFNEPRVIGLEFSVRR